MSDKDKKKDQAEGGKNAKDNKQAPTLNDTLEKVFRDVALIDPKENVEGVIKEILRQVRAMKTELTAEEMAQLVFENMQPSSRDHMLAGLLTDIFAKYGEMKTRHSRNMDELSPDISKGVFPYLHNYDDALYKEELYALQVELLKMQRYVKDAGLKIAVILKAVTLPVREVQFLALRRTSILAAHAWSLFPNPRTLRPVSGISSGTSRSFRVPVKWSSSTARGTTAPLWNR